MAWITTSSSADEAKVTTQQPSSSSSTVNALQSYADDISSRTSKLLGLQKTKMDQMEEACCSCCPEMTYQQRIGGYIFCLFISFCLTIGAATRIGDLLAGNPGPFAVFYTLQNLVAVCSSFFLSGPCAQAKKMCDSTRFVATTVFIFSMFATLFFAYYDGLPDGARVGLIVLFVIVQWCALIWYTLSYIPYAREYLCSCCQQACRDSCRCCDDCLGKSSSSSGGA